MKKMLLFLGLLWSANAWAVAEPVFIYDANGNPIGSAGGGLNAAIISSTLPTGAATETTLSAINVKLPTALGQTTMVNSLACVLPSDQSSIPAAQSGVWNITNVSGTVSLPTGASTEATLASILEAVHAEDAAHVSGDKGALLLGVRNDAGGAVAGTDGDYIPLTTDSSGALRVDASLTEVATAADGGVLPALTKVASGYDGTNVQVIKTDSNGELQVDVLTSTLPTGAATSANQTTANASLSSIDTKLPSQGQALMTASVPVVIASNQSALPISAVSLPLPTGAATEATLAAVSAKLPVTLGTQLIAGSMSVNIASDQTVPVSAASLPLPTGAATAVKQPALGVAGTPSVDVITVQGIASMTALKTDGSAVTQPISAASLPLPTGAATEATLAAASAKLPAVLGQTTAANSMSVVLASDQGTVNVQNISGTVSLPTGAATEATLAAASAKLPAALGQTTAGASFSVVIASDQEVPTKMPLNAGASLSAGTVTTAGSQIGSPASTVEMVVQAPEANTANLRVSFGTACTSTAGLQLQPGRSEVFHTDVDATICAESGTQAYTIQFFTR